ncbi:alpha/beta hydrolase [Streptomyces sp. A7024]|uniref:Alpha/beta hydrolase n=1 Tax=Streptomyces coryli TaxID=1128680 RepID=A0A6G4U4K3_9ACTN|nr:alpha/beta hydrolase [Streptomyces coryli]NGN66670.1 alpha/beta hydrolase [Streptomyces coryli]
MHSSRLIGTAAAVLASALLVSACSSGSSSSSGSAADPGSRAGHVSQTLAALPAAIPADLKPYYDQKLRWRACDTPGFECSTLRVPLDYAKPGEGDDVKLSVARKKASGPAARRIGSLQFNPGGPGASAVDFLTDYVGSAYPERIRARYDLVAADPRGVGHSEPVRCLSDKQMDRHTQTDQTPDNASEVKKLTAAFGTFAEGCEKRAGKLLGHVSTTEAARDMDVLRGALGDKKLHYVGASYGTMLGATYAGLFPSRAGRLVLDGAMDPSLTSLQLNREQNAGFTIAIDAFAKDCVRRKDCPLGTDGRAAATKRLNTFLESLDNKPLRTGEPRKLNESLATMGVLQSMYAKESWPPLRDALADAMKKKDGSALLSMADTYYEREPDGSYGDMMYAFTAVSCLDQPPAFDDPAEVTDQEKSFEKDSPVFGRDFAWAALNCGDWPVKATGEANRIEARGAGPILVIGTTRDPATPYIWAKSLASQLSSGVLLTYDADGHTAYGRGSGCVDSAVDRYLLTGKPPEDGTRC